METEGRSFCFYPEVKMDADTEAALDRASPKKASKAKKRRGVDVEEEVVAVTPFGNFSKKELEESNMRGVDFDSAKKSKRKRKENPPLPAIPEDEETESLEDLSRPLKKKQLSLEQLRLKHLKKLRKRDKEEKSEKKASESLVTAAKATKAPASKKKKDKKKNKKTSKSSVHFLPQLPDIDLDADFARPLSSEKIRDVPNVQLLNQDHRSKVLFEYLQFYEYRLSQSQESASEHYVDPKLLSNTCVVFFQHANAEINKLRLKVDKLTAQKITLKKQLEKLEKRKPVSKDYTEKVHTPASMMIPDFKGIVKFDGQDTAVDVVEWVAELERKLSVAPAHLFPHYFISQLSGALNVRYFDKFKPEVVMLAKHPTDKKQYDLIRSELIDTYKSLDAGDKAHTKLTAWNITSEETVYAGVMRLGLLLQNYVDVGQEISDSDKLRILRMGLPSDVTQRICDKCVGYREEYDYQTLIIQAIDAEKFVLQSGSRKKGGSANVAMFAAAQMLSETQSVNNEALLERLAALELQSEKFKNFKQKGKSERGAKHKTDFKKKEGAPPRKSERNPTGISLDMGTFKKNYPAEDWKARIACWKNKGKPSEHPKWYQKDTIDFNDETYLVCVACKRADLKGSKFAHQLHNCKKHKDGPGKK